MPENLKAMSDLGMAGSAVGVAGLGGFLHYLLKVKEGVPFKWYELVLHSAISAFAGYLCYEFLVFEGAEQHLIGCLCGMSGWFGTRALRIAEVFIARKKLGVDPSEMK